MPVTFEKNLPGHYVHCRMLGKGAHGDVLEYISELSADPELDQPFYEIVDFTELDVLEFGYNESNRLLSQYQELGQKKGYIGSIFIAGSTYSEALSKMFKTTGDFKGINIRVVQSLEEAEVLIDHLINQIEVSVKNQIIRKDHSHFGDLGDIALQNQIRLGLES